MAADGEARAEDTAAREAKHHYDRGVRAYDAGHYDEAFKEFEAGYAAMPRPGFILNMAHAQRRMGELRKARALYQRFLVAEPDSPQAETTKSAITEIDAAIKAEDDAAHRTPVAPTEPPPIPPPPVIAPMVIAPPPPPPPAPRRWYQRWWVWTAAGAVVAGTVTALAISLSGPDYADDGSLGSYHVPPR